MLLLIGILLFATTCAGSLQGDSAPPPPGPSLIPLSVHYLTDEKDIRKKFGESLEKSNATLMPHDIALVVWSEDRTFLLPENVETRLDRQLLKGHAQRDGTVHVFVVESVSVSSGDDLLGLYMDGGTRDFIILSKTARSTTLAHEVGHALGLDHEKGTDNVMCTCRKETGVRFTEAQALKMRRAARRLVKRDW